jgi:tRNA (guanine-N7-)-methyltransferase
VGAKKKLRRFKESKSLARKYPDRNFIGIDIKGARTWRGCKTAIEESLQNIAFIRSWVELVEHFFASNEVAEIWITHPDPQPRQSKAKKRLTSPQFLSRYANILQENSIIHLKTDDTALFEYTLEILENSKHEILSKTTDLYALNPE